ncbi:magnesium transporter CorA family protein [Neogemmobacter tilapiae]|uniref:Magnesium transport protein CorA n=1 Tax=Neogemmobacter tilapiae TaxID=875041 RepID=A0A918TQI7_9RHOB|nr:magnesium transporter CorA family protein [Gemmobacter tilapiae]GHC57759.1 magnesium transporter [Gemmobacter tilapiae]
MLFAYALNGAALRRMNVDEPLEGAAWIDLYRPTDVQAARLIGMGVEVPTLSDMEEIEISNRLYREGGMDVMTVVLPGLSLSKTPISGPVSFILTPDRLVTVRHHAPRPFETFPERADKSGIGCANPDQIFLGLVDEIIGRLADLLEGAGKSLDEVSAGVFQSNGAPKRPEKLQAHLEQVGREGDLVGRVRLSLLTIERALSFYTQARGEKNKVTLKALMRDIQALEVHCDFLSQRVGLASDATLGMINLSQNMTVRIVSVVAVLFLPPTLIASVYGMNFKHMPELETSFGYPVALLLMLASAVVTYLFFKWKNWL